MPVKYAASPISQVVCEFRFLPSADWDITLAGLLYSELKSQFPIKRPFKAVFSHSPGVNIETSNNELVQFVQEDEKALVQVGPNILSVIHNRPYPGWENYLPLIKSSLNAYIEIANPKGFQRVGLRYINRIGFDTPEIILSDWFQYSLQMPTGLIEPASMVNFLAVSNYLLEENRDVLTLQLGSAVPTVEEAAVCLLDIDYGTATTPWPHLNKVIEWLERAHLTIENIFEASIQEKLRDRFEPISQ